jgi:kumamolisin
MVVRKELKPISGSERAVVKNAKAIGKPDPNQIIEVTLVLRSAAAGVPISSVKEVSSMPLKERKYLTRNEFASASKIDADDLVKIEEFAHENGLTIVKISPESNSVILSGTLTQLSDAFGTTLACYEGPKGKYRGREGPIRVPSDLAPIVIGVFGLDDRHIFKPHFVRLEQQRGVVKARAATVSYTPLQLAKMYNFPSGLDGTKQCVAIIELGGGYKASDLKEYFKALKITPPKVTAIAVDGAANSPGSDADGEVVLDIEVAGSIAHKAKIAVYFAPNTDKGFIDAINAAVHDRYNNPSVISISWGAAEKEWTPQAMQAMDQAFQAAAAMGVTVFCAAGDDGSNDQENDNMAHADFPSTSPYVTGCGGTRLDSSGETTWNNGPGSATGGGISDFFPLPTWQSKANVPVSANPGGKTGRGAPDIAGDADPDTGYNIFLNGKYEVFGGTSAVAPLWAGMIALFNQNLEKPVGYLNPLLYGHLDMSGTLRDITVGDNGAYHAGPGWDACTGFGTPDGTKLLEALKKL